VLEGKYNGPAAKQNNGNGGPYASGDNYLFVHRINECLIFNVAIYANLSFGF